MLTKRLKHGVRAMTFAAPSWGGSHDMLFVTEFYGKGQDQLGYWEAPAVLDEKGHVDQKALESFHEANCAMWEEDGGIETT
jgi:hypothetical protein